MTETQLVRGLFDRVDTDTTGSFVKEHVAGSLNAAMQIDVAMSFLLPAMELVIAQPDRAVAEDGEALVETGFDGGRRNDRLERRSRRIDPAQRLVDERLVIVGRQNLPLVVRDPDIEKVGIESRRRGHREHVAGCDVHDGAGRALAAEALIDKLLELLIDGKPDV